MSCCTLIQPGMHFDRPVFQSPCAISGRADMVPVPAGRYLIGSDAPEAYAADGEGPERHVEIPAFLIGSCQVTNREFAHFVAETGYVTDAETIGWSFVFYAQVSPRALADARPAGPGVPNWWVEVPLASWAAPDGEGSDWHERADHPAVHISWNDATAYAQWAGQRLPTETEWEVAARGGLSQKRFPWGNELTPDGEHRCNIWQGQFPANNTGDDGYLWTAPARSFQPNAYGLFNMVGNCWEWCADSFNPNHHHLRAMRGGSYICHRSYCYRFRVSARTANTRDASSSHAGFRCAADFPSKEAS